MSLRKKSHLLFFLSMVLVVVSIFAPTFMKQIFYPSQNNDYLSHIQFAEQMLRSRTIQLPHFLWQLLVIAVQVLISQTPQASAVIVILASLVISCSIIYDFISENTRTTEDITIINWAICILSISLLIITPVNILAIYDQCLYFGYIGITTYHNPTIILLKPIALLHFYYTSNVFDKTKKHDARTILILTILSVLSALAKPSYGIILLPAIGLFIICRIIRKHYIDWLLLFAGVMMPLIITMAWQYVFTYSSGSNSHVIFAPFVVMSKFSNYLLPKFILSILFPLVVLCFYFKEVLKENILILSWMIFSFGVFYTYFFAESGPREFDGNFLWSGQIGLFILFVTLIMFLVKKFSEGRLSGVKAYILVSFFMFHVIAGVLFYIFELSRNRACW
jgi:hypothetical protein